MRRWRNQGNPGRGITKFGNNFIHLISRKLSSFAWFCALRDFNLEFVGINKVVVGHPKPAGSDLFYFTVFKGSKPFGIFPTLAGITSSADGIHGNGQRLVGFLADGAIRHRPGNKTFHNVLDRFNLVDGYRVLFYSKTATDKRRFTVLLVDQITVFFVFFVIVGPGSPL